MSSKKLLVIFGATGNQGGSTAHLVLDDPELSKQYTVRAITRSASNPEAQKLKAKGAEIIEADLDNPSTFPAALQDAHTVFAITYTQYGGGDTRAIETKQAKAVCDEAVKAGAQYIIWESMSHPAKISGGKLTKVAHFDVHAEIEEYVRGLPVKSAHYAPGSFMQNFTSYMAPTPSPAGDGSYVIANPCQADTKLPLIDITDTGKWITAILAEPDKYEGKSFSAAEGLYSMEEIVAALSKKSGKKVTFQHVLEDTFASFGVPEGIVEMYVHFREYGYYGPNMKEDVEWTRAQARGKLTGLEEFLEKVDFKLE